MTSIFTEKSNSVLLFHYTCDYDNNGMLFDLSGNHNDATTNGSISVTSAFSALHIGPDQYILPSISLENRTSFTFSMVIKPESIEGTQVLFTTSTSTSTTGLSDQSFTLYLIEGLLLAQYISGSISTFIHGTTAIAMDMDTRITFVYDNHDYSFSLFLNSDLEAYEASIPDNIQFSSSPIIIGGFYNTNNNHYGGLFRDIYLYNGALLPSEIEELDKPTSHFVIPLGTKYAKRVLSGSDFIIRDLGFQNMFQVREKTVGLTTIPTSTYLYDPSSMEAFEYTRTESVQKNDNGEINFSLLTDGNMQTVLSTNSENTIFVNGECKTCIDSSGISFDSDDACLWFGYSRDFRIKYDSSSTYKKLLFQSFDTISQEYNTKMTIVDI